jgi:hypothetical protein
VTLMDRYDRLNPNNPTHRAIGYGLLIRARLMQPTRPQLTRYPDHTERVLRMVRTAWRVPLSTDQERLVARYLYRQQLERHAYPGQPSTRTQPPTQPCTCWYTAWCCGYHIGGPTPQPPTWCPHTDTPTHLATGFMRNPQCTHHGWTELEGQQPSGIVVDEFARFAEQRANNDCDGE